jgi:predicted Zn-dependent protease
MQEFAGVFSDGLSAAQRPARVVLGGSALTLLDERNRRIAEWPYRDLRLVEQVYGGRPVRLKPVRGDARLVVRDPAFLGALARHARQLRRHDLQRSRAWPRAIVWGAATVATLVGLYFGLPLLAEPIAAVVPLEWEERMGRSVVAQAKSMFGRSSKECTAPAGRAALERLTARLAAKVESRYTFRVEVIENNIVNAFAAPGGYVVVFQGLIANAKSGDEVAGVLAHEMGHVIERHGTEALIRQIGMRVLVGAMVGDAAGIGSTAAEIGTQLASLSYGRAAEREADRVGLGMLNRANIRGAGLANFFQRMAEQSGERGPSIFRYVTTHPPSDERARDVAGRASGSEPAMNAEDWRALQAICSVKQ